VLDGIHDKPARSSSRGSSSLPPWTSWGHLVAGTAASTLLGLSDDATMLVLGSRGLGGFRGLLLGSVSHQVGVHAKVPVVVLRGDSAMPAMPGGPVVVGLDGSPASLEALGFAFDVASVTADRWWRCTRGLPVTTPGVTVPRRSPSRRSRTTRCA
jgi:nucleotide-binding universal stress UspA family protein